MADFSIADILAKGYQQRKQNLEQPNGIGPALGQVAGLANQYTGQVAANNQKQSVLQAQQDAAAYLSTPEGSRNPDLAQKGIRGMLALGITPPQTRQKSLSEIELEAAAREKGTSEARPAKTANPQDLSADEMSALTGAMGRKNNPLAPSIISFRGPRAKMMAQSLIKDPNWSPNAGESGLAGAKAGSAASARLTEGGSSQVVARTAQSAAEQLDLLQKASDSFPRANVQIMNTPIIALSKQGSVQAQRWLIAAQTARAEYATALNRGNSPSLEQIAEATKALPDTITPSQLPGAIAQLRAGLDATVKGQMTAVSPGEIGKTSPALANSGAANDPLGIR